MEDESDNKTIENLEVIIIGPLAAVFGLSNVKCGRQPHQMKQFQGCWPEDRTRLPSPNAP